MIAPNAVTVEDSVPAKVWCLGTIACIGLCLCVALGWILWDRTSKLALLSIQYLVLLPAAWSVRRRDTAPGTIWSRATAPFSILAYCCLAFPLAGYLSNSIYSGDESAYLFQARLFADGKLTAEAPGGGVLDPASALNNPKVFHHVFRFQQHLIVDGKWFGKYPPGWPILLAPATLARMEAFVNPLAGLGILWLTWRIGLLLFGAMAADLSLLFLVSSPFFTLNCTDYLSHASASFFLALAVYCLVLAWNRRVTEPKERIGWYLAAMMAALFVLCMIRPYVAVWSGSVLGAGAVWILRGRGRNILLLVCSGIGTAAFAVIVLLLYNRAVTGAVWPYTYALYTHTRGIVEVNWLPVGIWKNLTALTPISLAETLLASFPFAFLLALFAMWRDHRRSKIVLLLGALIFSLMLGYLGQSFSSFSLIGERYYFEVYFLVALLAAWGWILFWGKRRTAQANLLFASLLLIQAFMYPVYLHRSLQAHRPSLQVLSVAKGLGLHAAVIFLRSSSQLRAFDLNPNAAQWRDAPVFMLKDPGESLRSDVVCALGRSRWIVIGYDDSLAQPLVGPAQQARCRSVALR